MMRSRTGLFLAIFLLAGCDHHQSATPAQTTSAAVQSDTDLTGESPGAASPSRHAYPRAKLVALPAQPAPAPSPQPTTVAATPAAPPASEPTPTPPPVSTPAEPAPAVATTLPESSSAPAPAPAADSNPDMARLAITPPPATVSPATALDEHESKRQVVVLETSLGRIVIELDDVSAPRTCGNFRKLVSDGFYDHTVFHRIIPRFMIQGGDPNSKSDDRLTYGQGDPGYTLPAEIKLPHVAGAVAMARLPDSANPQRDSNGSQFFICVAPCSNLDGQYTVFGHVIAGMDTANKIANAPRDPHDDPTTRIEMQAHLESKKTALTAASGN